MADGTLYLAMEYIDGKTLDAVIAHEGPLPILRAAQITKQVADALHAAHHLGIVHRDLKPENVMVARHLDGSGRGGLFAAPRPDEDPAGPAKFRPAKLRPAKLG